MLTSKSLMPLAKVSTQAQLFWLSLSLIISLFFGAISLKEAFRGEFIIQDDAQQHVFWFWRFVDSELFPNDLIADYYQSIAQPGYIFIYKFAAFLGIEPIFFSKLIPPLLALITTAYCFYIVLQIFPVPVAGFVSTVLLNQNIWLKDDLASATARAFLYPLLFAFLYYLLKKSLFPCLASLLLLGLIYPIPLLICAGILLLRLIKYQNRKLSFSRHKKDYLLSLSGLGVIFLVLLPILLETSTYGPTVTADVARNMIEFSEEGRTRLFINDPIEFWLYGGRTGFFPVEWEDLPAFYFPILAAIGFSLPLLKKYPNYFPLVQRVNSNVFVLPQLLLVSTVLFLAAHAVLFKLYLPSRYSQYSLRIFMAIAAGIVLTVVFDKIFKILLATTQQKRLAVAISLLALFITYPLILRSQDIGLADPLSYKSGYPTGLYSLLRRQPKDILIASTSSQVNRIPALAKRSILVGQEHSIPYHEKYYSQIKKRLLDLIEAQYSPERDTLISFIQKYGVDLWLLDKDYLISPYGDEDIAEEDLRSIDVWLRQFPESKAADLRAKQGIKPELLKFVPNCSIFENEDLILLKAECILTQSK